MPMDRLGVS